MKVGTIKEIWRYPVKSMGGEILSECYVGRGGIPGDRGWALRDETTREITNGKRLPLLMQCNAEYLGIPEEHNIPPVELALSDGKKVRSTDTNLNETLSNLLGKKVSLWPLQPAENVEHYRRNSTSARLFARLARNRAFRRALPTLTSFGNPRKQLEQMFSREPGEPVPDIATLPPELLEFTSPRGTYFDAYPIHVITTASLASMTERDASVRWDVRRFRPNFLIETEPELKGLLEADWSGSTLRIGDVELRCELPAVRCGMTMHAQNNLPKEPGILRAIVKFADQNLGSYANVLNSGAVSTGDAVDLIC